MFVQTKTLLLVASLLLVCTVNTPKSLADEPQPYAEQGVRMHVQHLFRGSSLFRILQRENVNVYFPPNERRVLTNALSELAATIGWSFNLVNHYYEADYSFFVYKDLADYQKHKDLLVWYLEEEDRYNRSIERKTKDLTIRGSITKNSHSGVESVLAYAQYNGSPDDFARVLRGMLHGVMSVGQSNIINPSIFNHPPNLLSSRRLSPIDSAVIHVLGQVKVKGIVRRNQIADAIIERVLNRLRVANLLK